MEDDIPNFNPITHTAEKVGRSHGWDHEKSASERGYGAEWRKLRQRVYARDRKLCQVCKADGGLTPANEVDHIIPKSKGGIDGMENLQAICSPCHKAKTLRERRQ